MKDVCCFSPPPPPPVSLDCPVVRARASLDGHVGSVRTGPCSPHGSTCSALPDLKVSGVWAACSVPILAGLVGELCSVWGTWSDSLTVLLLVVPWLLGVAVDLALPSDGGQPHPGCVYASVPVCMWCVCVVVVLFMLFSRTRVPAGFFFFFFGVGCFFAVGLLTPRVLSTDS